MALAALLEKGSDDAVGNTEVELDGGEARTCTHAFAHVVIGTGAEQKKLVRGLRYDDFLVIEAERWRIRRRTHLPLWQYNAAGVVPGL